MRLRRATMRLTSLLAFAQGAASYAATMNFESVPPGTSWGVQTGQQPGDTVLAEGGIIMSLETFVLGPDETDFFRAQVPALQDPYADAFPSQELALDTINALFDFTALGFDVDFASLEFIDFGGLSNLSVNGAEVFILDPFADAPQAVAPGVMATILDDARIEFQSVGTSIDRILVGGQELVIDNVTALPEPGMTLWLLTGAVLLARRRR